MPQLSSDPLGILIKFEPWATRLLLNLCKPLSHEQFHRKFEVGLGSLHDTFTHIVSVMRRWTDRVAGRTPRPMLQVMPQYPHLSGESKDRTPADLLMHLDEAERDLEETAKKADLASTVTLDWPGDDGAIKIYTFTRGVVLMHLCVHGAHHRAQILNMLRHMNVPGLSDKLPDPSVVDWQAEVEAPPASRPK